MYVIPQSCLLRGSAWFEAIALNVVSYMTNLDVTHVHNNIIVSPLAVFFTGSDRIPLAGIQSMRVRAEHTLHTTTLASSPDQSHVFNVTHTERVEDCSIPLPPRDPYPILMPPPPPPPSNCEGSSL
jgi:hypothetical protein